MVVMQGKYLVMNTELYFRKTDVRPYEFVMMQCIYMLVMFVCGLQLFIQ